MRYRTLGKTGLRVSEVGFGAEWIGEMSPATRREVMDVLNDGGVNIVDCWMSDPDVRDALGQMIAPNRDQWIVQAHIGSTWQDGQYVRTREMDKVTPAFEDELRRLKSDSFELGMIHYVDEVAEYHSIMEGEFLEYVLRLRDAGTIQHIGLSTHNPEVGLLAAKSGIVEMIMFSINPAFDMLPASEDINTLFEESYDAGLSGIEKVRAELYETCEREDVGITVMKPYAGGRLLDAEKSPFGVALTPAQCIHYCLTRPAVASVMAGVSNAQQAAEALAYEDATEDELDYASVLANAPAHSYAGQCTYCGHCQPCVVGINIAMVNKFHDLAASQDTVPESVRAHYLDMDAAARDCFACHGCESRCPFGVKIVDKMKAAVELFGA